MEFGCIWLILCFSALVCGYTPTFRNEATHPLKAPTESTLGLQINDELAGQTKSNTPKQETYISGGKHFEYLLLNDSNVLLTSLQNDGPFETPPQQTRSSKDDSFAKSNSSYDATFRTDSNNEKSNETNSFGNVGLIEKNATTRSLLDTTNSISFGDRRVKKNESKSNVVDQNAGQSSVYTSSTQNKAFDFDKLLDISSTTKLYSKHANKSDENFASFTSPLVGGKPIASVYNYDKISERTRTTNNSNSQQRTNYDYDDSFTKLLISNGILKPENVTTSKGEEESAAARAYKPTRVFRGDYPSADANPSIEDINRIMDGSIVRLIRNNTMESKNIISSRSKISTANQVTSAPKANAKMLSVTRATLFKSARQDQSVKTTPKITLLSPVTNENQKFATNASDGVNVQTTNGSLVDDDQMESNENDHVEGTTKSPSSAEVTSNLFNGDEKSLDSVTRGRKEISITSLHDSTTNSTQFENLDTDVPAITITEQRAKTNSEKPERKPISTFSELVRTDLSNENPLAVGSYTDSSRTLPFSEKNDVYLTIVPDIFANGKSATDTSTGGVMTHRPSGAFVKSLVGRQRIENYASRNIVPLTRFYSFGDSKVVPSHEIENKNSGGSTAKQGRNISVGEFKTLIEKSIRSLFFPVAKYFDEYKETLLKNGSANRTKNLEYFDLSKSKGLKVTLKRFGLANVIELLKNKSKMDDRSALWVDGELGRSRNRNAPLWTDLRDGRNIDMDESIDNLFAEEEEEDEVHWFVILLAGNSTIARMRKEDFVKYLKVNLAARLSLEYNDVKINAIIVVPPSLAVNVSLPANESSIDVNEELDVERDQQEAGPTRELAQTNATLLELSGQEYRVLQLLSLKSQHSTPDQTTESRRVVDKKHDDIEMYIFVFLGAICTFGVLSPLLYGVYRLIQNHTNDLSAFKIPAIFGGDKFHHPYQSHHEKMSESRCESLNVIFSEDFDRKYSSSSLSWFDNSQHSSSILKPSTEAPSSFFNDAGSDDYSEFSDFARNAIENSPRLNKENKLNMLGCRPSCVLLPHPATYLMHGENEERYFDNPNYNQDAR